MARRLRHVILDRDGVLNQEGSGPVTVSADWSWEIGARAGLSRLAEHGVAVSVATNQSAIGRGLVAADAVEGVHRWLRDELEHMGVDVVGVFVCPHLPDARCNCRKPRPGLLLDALASRGYSADETVMIGDDVRDIEAAVGAGTAAALVRTGKGRSVEAMVGAEVDVFDDLDAVVRHLVGDSDR